MLNLVRLFATPWTCSPPGSLFMEFSRQEYWSGLPFSTPGDLPGPGIEPISPASPALAGRVFIIEPPGKPKFRVYLPHISKWAFQVSQGRRKSACSARDAGATGSIPGSGTSHMLPLQGLSSLVNPSRPLGTSLMAQLVKNLPAMWETWVRSLGQENPLERGWQPSPVFLPEEFHGQRSLAGYSSWLQRVGRD